MKETKYCLAHYHNGSRITYRENGSWQFEDFDKDLPVKSFRSRRMAEEIKKKETTSSVAGYHRDISIEEIKEVMYTPHCGSPVIGAITDDKDDTRKLTTPDLSQIAPEEATFGIDYCTDCSAIRQIVGNFYRGCLIKYGTSSEPRVEVGQIWDYCGFGDTYFISIVGYNCEAEVYTLVRYSPMPFDDTPKELKLGKHDLEKRLATSYWELRNG